MSQHSDTRARDKALADADRESRIVAFLGAMPDDMEPAELESVIFAIVSSYMPEKILPLFFFYLGSTYGKDSPFDEPTTH